MPVLVRQLGREDYLPVWQRMKQFTDCREPSTADEIWFVEHPAVYTLGVRDYTTPDNQIPVVQTDRGGLITYHGPGQIVVYLLLDVRRLGLGVKQLVRLIEAAIIDVLCQNGIQGERQTGAPGVYVDNAKIAALGLRIRRGCCYHGLSLNVDMDLVPFDAIDPCGLPGQLSTQMNAHHYRLTIEGVSKQLESALLAQLGFSSGEVLKSSI